VVSLKAISHAGRNRTTADSANGIQRSLVNKLWHPFRERLVFEPGAPKQREVRIPEMSGPYPVFMRTFVTPRVTEPCSNRIPAKCRRRASLTSQDTVDQAAAQMLAMRNKEEPALSIQSSARTLRHMISSSPRFRSCDEGTALSNGQTADFSESATSVFQRQRITNSMRSWTVTIRLVALIVLLTSAADYSAFDPWDPSAPMNSAGVAVIQCLVPQMGMTASATDLPDDHCLCCSPWIAAKSPALPRAVLSLSAAQSVVADIPSTDPYLIERPPRA
jgi:hypothetical protein